jgi:hypothetical protein
LTTSALLIYERDFPKRRFLDWLFSHISGALPPHRYKGILTMEEDCLMFQGYDTLLKTDTSILIHKETIRQVYHGYDSVYTIFRTRGLGLFWSPVRLELKSHSSYTTEYLYIVVGYHKISTLNKEFYRYLTEWLS